MRSGLPLAALVFAVVLTPGSGWANTTPNCPPEPAQGTPISSGETFTGSNCVLKTTGDLDTFTFNASAGDTWTMIAGVEPAAASDICLSLYAPGSTGTAIFSGCTIAGGGVFSTGTTMKLTAAGAYTIVIIETANGTTGYSLSLERISPPPPDATTLPLKTNVTGAVTVPTEQIAYSFYGATTGTYRIVASYTGGPDNVCFTVYQSGTNVGGGICTIAGGEVDTIAANVTPTANGTLVVLVYTATNDSTVSYNLEVTCFLGKCPSGPPTCTLTDTPSYDASTGTLTMNFTVATSVAVTWNAWLTSGNTIQQLWSQSQPITEPAVPVPMTQTGVSKSGKVGILSTFTTASTGITCSSWQTVSTGTP